MSQKIIMLISIKKQLNMNKKLADVLSHLMHIKGINSAELARLIGIGQPVIYRLMTGVTANPQVFTLKPIADYFHISIDQLLGYSPLEIPTAGFQKTYNLKAEVANAATILSSLINVLPIVTEGYQQAVSANLIPETISPSILPLIILNTSHLQKMIQQIQENISLLSATSNETVI